MTRTLHNLLAVWIGISLPWLYLFVTTPELRRPEWRLYLLDSLGILGPWLWVRLLLAGAIFLLLATIASFISKGLTFRLAAIFLAGATSVVAGLAIFGTLPSVLTVLCASLVGLLIKMPSMIGVKDALSTMRPELVFLAVGLLATLLQAYPPLFLYSLWRPEGDLSTRNILQRNPKLDLKINLLAEDYRVVCLSGLGLVCPPYHNEEGFLGYHYLDEFGLQLVEGTSDAPGAGLDVWLQGVAYDYADQYNQGLFEYVRLHPQRVSRPTKPLHRAAGAAGEWQLRSTVLTVN